MIDSDLYTLVNQRPDRMLDRLEADIWRRIESRAESRYLSRVVASCQMTAMVIALAGSAVFGAVAASSYHPQRDIISYTNIGLAPSTLLLGRTP